MGRCAVKMTVAVSVAVVSAMLCAPASGQQSGGVVALAQQKSLEEAGKVYPELKDANSVLWQTAHRLAMEAQDPNSINHALVSNPNAPMLFAELAVKALIADQGNAQADQADWPMYAHITQSLANVKTTMPRGWSVRVDESYLFVRFMSTREYESGGKFVEKVKSDRNYAVLKLDDDYLMVPVDALESVPNSGARFTVAGREYEIEVRQKRAADAQNAR
jgi:hypothetical protein